MLICNDIPHIHWEEERWRSVDGNTLWLVQNSLQVGGTGRMHSLWKGGTEKTMALLKVYSDSQELWYY